MPRIISGIDGDGSSTVVVYLVSYRTL